MQFKELSSLQVQGPLLTCLLPACDLYYPCYIRKQPCVVDIAIISNDQGRTLVLGGCATHPRSHSWWTTGLGLQPSLPEGRALPTFKVSFLRLLNSSVGEARGTACLHGSEAEVLPSTQRTDLGGEGGGAGALGQGS